MRTRAVRGLSPASIIWVIASFGLAVALAGCSGAYTSPTTQASTDTCGGDECHAKTIEAQAAGRHSALACIDCHADAVEGGHAEDPEGVEAAINWKVDACSGCHAHEADTYLYDDNLQVGPFGGSQREPAQPKADTFPEYPEIVAGHPFANDYNEEGAHAFMLEDHYATTRGKFETCVQCKSSKVAYAWDTGRPITVAADTDITLTHTAKDGNPAQVVTIPGGTQVTYSTDDEYNTLARAEFPDGTVYTSYDATESGGVKDFNMLWATTIAAIDETRPYGAGCNHCHEPHTGEPRIIRNAMKRAIEKSGVNPYEEGSAASFDEASLADKRNLTCSQCHVEYVCGKSGVDGIDRDFFSWSKAGDLHELYWDTFDYTQDWTQKTIGETLIKSQHPETELFWQSAHDKAQVSCADCHMPRVRRGDGTLFRSHWFTSPYKYQDPAVFSEFAKSTGVKPSSLPTPCQNCHTDRTSVAIQQQEAVYERQKAVEALLAESSALLGEVKAAEEGGTKIDAAKKEAAVEAHRKAHVLWENIIVSENSMGFHNYGETMTSMDAAQTEAEAAIAQSKQLLGS